MKHRTFARFGLFAVAATTLAIAVEPAAAAQYDWNVASGSFDNPANWNPNGVPDFTDVAVIDNGGTATFNIAPFRDVDTLRVGSAPGTSGTIAITGGDMFAKGIRIGEEGTGIATVNNGIMRAGGSGSLFVGGDLNAATVLIQKYIGRGQGGVAGMPSATKAAIAVRTIWELTLQRLNPPP